MVRCVFYILVVLVSEAGFAGALEERGWLAWGDLRGYVEPCGCDPTADLGGIQRQSRVLEKERALSKQLLLFNLGNNLPVATEDEAHKIPVLLTAVDRMRPDGALFNILEAKAHKFGKFPGAESPYVASNLLKKVTGVKAGLSIPGVNVFGFTEPTKETRDYFGNLTEKLVGDWRKQTQTKAQSVLLFSGTEQSLKKILASKFFDLVISANATKLTAVVGPREKEAPNLLRRQGGQVMMVPVGGQGFLRGGKLLTRRARPLREMLQDQNCKPGSMFGSCPPKAESGGLLQVEQVTWLSRDRAGPSPLDDLYARYQNASADVFARLADQRAKDLESSPFIGSQACQSCHASAYKSWQESAHSHALATLDKVGKSKDPECVTCHVTGYKDKGGFADRDRSPQFANVNCENCHGPRKDHVTNPSQPHPWRNKAKEVCVSCHHGTHTPHFDYDEYWPKIQHGGG